MCELFAISSRLPATVSLSLKTLAEHGGGSTPHADGWGIAYYREDDARLIKDTSAAHDSDWVSCHRVPLKGAFPKCQMHFYHNSTVPGRPEDPETLLKEGCLCRS